MHHERLVPYSEMCPPARQPPDPFVISPLLPPRGQSPGRLMLGYRGGTKHRTLQAIVRRILRCANQRKWFDDCEQYRSRLGRLHALMCIHKMAEPLDLARRVERE